jgi:prolyl 3-hydroxylase /prolyl 3,4-dihydroxylase
MEPFPHVVLKNFLPEEKARALAAALRKQKFRRKDADLFSFSQTADLYTVQDKTIGQFLELLQSAELNAKVDKLLGVKTTVGKVDASGFKYTDTDYLLCHDDGVSSRRIAYIYNLSEGFTAKDGGALALMHTKNNVPTSVAKRIIPAWNTLIIFPVTKKSQHQVEEVLNAKERLTITGWFHA